MLVPLAFTLNLPRACICAGVLQEHGLFADVWDERSAFYGPVPSGGYRLMVEEHDLAEAAAILNSSVPPHEPEAGEGENLPSGLSLDQSVGQGVLTGLWLLPLLVMVIAFLVRLALVMRNPGISAEPVFGGMGLSSWLSISFMGAILGALAGFLAWLVSSYKRDHPAGQAFVTLVVICLLAASVLIAIG